MKLVTYLDKESERIGVLTENGIYSLAGAADRKGIKGFPADMLTLLQGGEAAMDRARELEAACLGGKIDLKPADPSAVTLLAPVPRPASCRDAYAFRQHVAAARRNRGVDMIPEFDEYPVFYFTNHNAVQGPGDIRCMPDHFDKLDFELEWAAVIGRRGMNITAAEADDYIAGYTIMNDMSARTLQMEEMKLNLGPAKGKDFTTVIGPWLVTPDELESFPAKPREGHTGRSYRLDMTCRVNGKEVSRGNTADMDWTFAEIIERCAYGTPVMPGDVIGSGTVGTGCFLELNGTGRLHDPGYPVQWLKDGDVIEMEVTGLGLLRNTIRRQDSDFSLLALKKKRAMA